MRICIVAFICLLIITPHQITSGEVQKHFWRVEKDTKNTWWFVSPQGNREFLTLVNNLDQNEFGGYKAKNPLDLQKRVLEYGFKGLDAWSDPIYYQSGIPFCKDLNISKYVSIDRIVDNGWEILVKNILSAQISPLAGNINLIGYYLDNELHWDKIGEKSALKYFSVIIPEIRRLDPHHLILGVRLNKKPPEWFGRLTAGYIDVQSVNIYSDEIGFCKNLSKDSNTPIIRSEFSFYSDDNKSGNLNTVWKWGGKSNSQKDRAKRYENSIIYMASQKYFVGASWFQWSDQPPNGRIQDGEDTNFGVVDIYDNPYPLLVEKIQETKMKVNNIHAEIR